MDVSTVDLYLTELIAEELIRELTGRGLSLAASRVHRVIYRVMSLGRKGNTRDSIHVRCKRENAGAGRLLSMLSLKSQRSMFQQER